MYVKTEAILQKNSGVKELMDRNSDLKTHANTRLSSAALHMSFTSLFRTATEFLKNHIYPKGNHNHLHVTYASIGQATPSPSPHSPFKPTPPKTH